MKRNYFLISLLAVLTLSICTECSSNSKKKNPPPTQGKVVYLTEKEFNSKVYAPNSTNYLGEYPCIVDFSASWCGPCLQMAPHLSDLAVIYKSDLIIYNVDIDKQKELAKRFKIKSIPSLLYIPMKGKPFVQLGYKSKKELKENIKKHLLK